MKYCTLILLFITGPLSAQTSANYFELADEFFQTYVENGQVKYAEIKKNPKALNTLLAEAKKVKVSPKNEAEYQAFWINAYNIAVIQGIVQSYPVKSPNDIKGFFNEKKYSLGQTSVSLDEIEKELLQGSFPEEERFHFVLVCAAKSCPALLSKAYWPQSLEDQLQEQTVNALNDPNFVKITGNKVEFSEMMKWYYKDFTKGNISLIEYANKYRTKKIPAGIPIRYYSYNWELNEL